MQNGVSISFVMLEDDRLSIILPHITVLIVNVDVSSHKIGSKESFGKVASDMWQSLMQMAEGPNAFRAGYEKMMSKYSKDARRRRYIEELFRTPDKHHFSRNLR